MSSKEDTCYIYNSIVYFIHLYVSLLFRANFAGVRLLRFMDRLEINWLLVHSEYYPIVILKKAYD